MDTTDNEAVPTPEQLVAAVKLLGGHVPAQTAAHPEEASNAQLAVVIGVLQAIADKELNSWVGADDKPLSYTAYRGHFLRPYLDEPDTASDSTPPWTSFLLALAETPGRLEFLQRTEAPHDPLTVDVRISAACQYGANVLQGLSALRLRAAEPSRVDAQFVEGLRRRAQEAATLAAEIDKLADGIDVNVLKTPSPFGILVDSDTSEGIGPATKAQREKQIEVGPGASFWIFPNGDIATMGDYENADLRVVFVDLDRRD